MMCGDYEKELTFFEDRAVRFQEIGDTHRLAQVLNYQGFNALALHAIAEAQTDFCKALNLA